MTIETELSDAIIEWTTFLTKKTLKQTDRKFVLIIGWDDQRHLIGERHLFFRSEFNVSIKKRFPW